MNIRILFIVSVACFFPIVASAEKVDVSYNRDVRPILAAKCFTCHGPDDAAREAELRLDTFEGATAKRDDGPAIAPSDPAASQMMARLLTNDADLRMPPADSGEPLTDKQIAILKKWIASGAEYQKHWSLEPITRPSAPVLADDDWSRSPIDRFILARLQQQGLSPSAEADRFTLIRRVYLDLLGLTPSLAEVQAFNSDKRPDAYEQMVDRALASHRFGERWGRHWLDQARYADSHGYTNDNERVMWPYRDWVINAVNRDQPFDQFTTEQLAGDLLPNPTLAQQIATGFHRNTLINTEGGTKADQFRDEQVKDRVDTTGGVWLGLTVGCAKCHSHKYDPITQHEYYQLYAFFNSTADNNSVPPVLKAPTSQQEVQLAQLTQRKQELDRALAEDTERSSRQQAWEAALVERYKASQAGADDKKERTPWTVLDLDGKSNAGAVFTGQEDQSLLVSGENTIADFYQVTTRAPLTTIRSVRLEVLTHEDLPKQGPGRAANGNFVLAEFWFRTGDGRELRFSKAQADHSQPKFGIGAAIDNNDGTGWAINGAPEGGPNHNRVAWFVLPKPLVVEQDHALTFNFKHHEGASPYNIGRFRISVSDQEWVDAPSEADLAKLAVVPSDQRGEAQTKRLTEAFLRSDAKLAPVYQEQQTIAKQLEKLQGQVASTMVMRELPKPRPTHVQHRGDFLQPADQVQPGGPESLPPFPQSATSRLDLASWLFAPENPLTARVRVNRIWMRLFGQGIVGTENDFGAQGSLPTHPELLDWLASEQMRQAWSTKRLIRSIVTSAVYRQASYVEGEGVKVDPQNYLLWRQNRVRVEGEIVRDLMLSASGLLSSKIGGPGVYPPQPDGVYAFTQRAKNWKTSQGEDRYRRGMYTFFYRSAPYPMLSTFDAPKFNQTCTRRDRSNTPLQSLTVANDASLFEMTQVLAARVLAEQAKEPSDDAERLKRLFRICLTRQPSSTEANFLQQFLAQQRSRYAAQPDAAKEIAPANLPQGVSPAEAAAWTATARVLLNLDEFITRE